MLILLVICIYLRSLRIYSKYTCARTITSFYEYENLSPLYTLVKLQNTIPEVKIKFRKYAFRGEEKVEKKNLNHHLIYIYHAVKWIFRKYIFCSYDIDILAIASIIWGFKLCHVSYLLSRRRKSLVRI